MVLAIRGNVMVKIPPSNFARVALMLQSFGILKSSWKRLHLLPPSGRSPVTLRTFPGSVVTLIFCFRKSVHKPDNYIIATSKLISVNYITQATLKSEEGKEKGE